MCVERPVNEHKLPPDKIIYMRQTIIRHKTENRARRKGRVRSKIRGTKERPRISVFRSNSYIYAQLVDDETGSTITEANDREVDMKKVSKDDLKGDTGTVNLLRAFKTGEMLAKKAQDKKVTTVVFDKSHYKFHGRVKALAEGARAGGLKF